MNLSFREKSLWIDLIATLAIAIYYVGSLLNFGPEKLADIHAVMDLLWDIVFLSIMVSILSWAALSTHDKKSAKAPLDEREEIIELRATRYGYWTLQVAISTVVLFYGLVTSDTMSFEDLLPFSTLHIIVASFVISELVVTSTQLWGLQRDL